MNAPQYRETPGGPSSGAAPTAKDLHSALVALANGSLEVEAVRIIMRRSRRENGPALHERLKAEAVVGRLAH